MKRILSIPLVFIAIWSVGQNPILPIDSIRHQATYFDTIRVAGVDAPLLYSRAKDFIENGKWSASEVMRTVDVSKYWIRASGTIKYKTGNAPVSAPMTTGVTPAQISGGSSIDHIISFNFNIKCKDGFIVYQITNFTLLNWETTFAEKKPGNFDSGDPGGMTRHRWKLVQSFVDKRIKKQLENFTNALNGISYSKSLLEILMLE